MESVVPKWTKTSNVMSGSSMPRRYWPRTRWPEDEIGRNSARPWTSPRTAASHQDMERGGGGVRAWRGAEGTALSSPAVLQSLTPRSPAAPARRAAPPRGPPARAPARRLGRGGRTSAPSRSRGRAAAPSPRCSGRRCGRPPPPPAGARRPAGPAVLPARHDHGGERLRLRPAEVGGDAGGRLHARLRHGGRPARAAEDDVGAGHAAGVGPEVVRPRVPGRQRSVRSRVLADAHLPALHVEPAVGQALLADGLGAGEAGEGVGLVP